MNKLIVIILILFSAQSFGGTDMVCIQNCTEEGHLYGFCKSKCDSAPEQHVFQTETLKRTDLTCVQNCQDAGYSYGLCKNKCTY